MMQYLLKKYGNLFTSHRWTNSHEKQRVPSLNSDYQEVEDIGVGKQKLKHKSPEAGAAANAHTDGDSLIDRQKFMSKQHEDKATEVFEPESGGYWSEKACSFGFNRSPTRSHINTLFNDSELKRKTKVNT